MDCPTCEKSLDTEQGVRIHHAKVHDEHLPNRVCKGCDSRFYDSDSKRSYCADCNPNAGSNNGNWNGAKESTKCEICSRTFDYYPSNKKGLFCSDCVEKTDEFLGDPYVKDAERIERECEYCEEPMEVLLSTIRNGNGRFCSRDCLAKWMSENRIGDAHHQWEGGGIYYGQKWWRIRQEALERDEHTCQHCGIHQDDLNRSLDVHHLERVRSFDEPQDARTLDDVVVLCCSCHRNVEESNVPISEVGV